MKKEEIDKYIEEELKDMSDRELQEEIYRLLAAQGRNASERGRMLYWAFVIVGVSLGILLYNFPPPWLR